MRFSWLLPQGICDSGSGFGEAWPEPCRVYSPYLREQARAFSLVQSVEPSSDGSSAGSLLKNPLSHPVVSCAGFRTERRIARRPVFELSIPLALQAGSVSHIRSGFGCDSRSLDFLLLVPLRQLARRYRCCLRCRRINGSVSAAIAQSHSLRFGVSTSLSAPAVKSPTMNDSLYR